MKKPDTAKNGTLQKWGGSAVSTITGTYLTNMSFLKKYLARFFFDRQDIEDVAQEAYLRAYAAEQKGDISQPKAYLFRIAKNLALTSLTRKSKQITDYFEEIDSSLVLDNSAAADEEAEALESIGLYCEAVAAMPAKCRQVFLLRKVHGLSHKEIAQQMSLSASSIEKYLMQGVSKCSTYIAEREAPQSAQTQHSTLPKTNSTR